MLKGGEQLFKVLFVGDSEVISKTAMFLRLSEEKTSSGQTGGFSSTEVTRKHLDLQGRQIQLEIWHSVTQTWSPNLRTSYYKGVHGIICCYNGENVESFDKSKIQLNEMDFILGNSIPKLLLGVYLKHQQNHPHFTNEAALFAEEHSILFLETSLVVETSSDSHVQLDEVLIIMAREICICSLEAATASISKKMISRSIEKKVRKTIANTITSSKSLFFLDSSSQFKCYDSQELNKIESLQLFPQIENKSFNYLKEIKELNLRDNNFQVTPSFFFELSRNLQILHLSDNCLTSISPSIANLTDLQYLNLNNNRLQPTALEPLKFLTQLEVLKIDSNHLSILPNSITHLACLVELTLNKNKFKIFPHQIHQLTTLKRLQLNHNKISDIPCLLKLVALESLQITNNRLKPFRFDFFSKLRALHIENNVLLSVSFKKMCYTYCINAKSLDLSYYNMTQIDPEIVFLTSLTRLDLAHNQLTQVSPIVCQLKQLLEFSVEDNQLAEFPGALVCMGQLQVLDLSSNRLPSIDPLVTKLTSLQKLHLSNNQIQSLPIELFRMENLKYLDLSLNKLRLLPEETWHMYSLVEIHLNGNFLESIPESLLQLPLLRQLHLGKNILADFPIIAVTSTTPRQLENIYLNTNCFGVFPLGLCQLCNLKHINLDDQLPALNELPSQLRYFTSLLHLSLNGSTLSHWHNLQYLSVLQKLQLNSCSLLVVPVEIASLVALQHLTLDNNFIRSLPFWIGQLTSITYLSIQNNHLTYLPPSLANLSKLSVLNLTGNENFISTPPLEVVRAGLSQIQLYLQEALVTGTKRCFRQKLMIVGVSAAGKTSLVGHLKKGKKIQTTTTNGIEIGQWEANVFVKPLGKKHKISFSVWDFAGQEEFYSTHQFFLTKRGIFLLIWNLTQSEKDARIEFWLQSIHSKAGPNASVIIVGTHLDLLSNPEVQLLEFEEQAGKYNTRFPTMIQSIHAVSCLSGENIHVLVQSIKEVTGTQQYIGENIPLSYLKLESFIKDQTRDLQACGVPPVISLKELQAKSLPTAGIIDDDEFIRALSFLNDVGVITYFAGAMKPYEDFQNIASWVFLQPSWLTKMMACVITIKEKQSFTTNGILKHEHLKFIWPEPDFPQDLHPMLFNILKYFEICYEMVASDSFYDGCSLIPVLLPPNRPFANRTAVFKSFNKLPVPSLARLLRFSFLPSGFFAKLMVRLFNLVEPTDYYWLHGMVVKTEQLEDDNMGDGSADGTTIAVIEENLETYSLNIEVQGISCVYMMNLIIDGVLAIISSWFEFDRIRVQAFVPCVHCIRQVMRNVSDRIWEFSQEKLQSMLAEGQTYVMCGYNPSKVPIAHLIPDSMLNGIPKIKITQLKCLRQIAEGSSGEVYTATLDKSSKQPELTEGFLRASNPSVVKVEQQQVVFKKLKNLEKFNEFHREARNMSKLKHKNIVFLIGVCLNPPGLVLEYLNRGDLYKFLHGKEAETKSIDFAFHFSLALDIANGMSYLHHQCKPSVVHRDLKSPNILLTYEAQANNSAKIVAKVADFGTLEVFSPTLKGKSGVDNDIWLAPEVIDGQEYTEKADVYSFAIILWELLTRRIPWEEYKKQFRNVFEFRMALIERRLRPSISDTLRIHFPSYCSLINSCWDPNSAQRPSFLYITSTLQRCINQVPTSTTLRFSTQSKQTQWQLTKPRALKKHNQ